MLYTHCNDHSHQPADGDGLFYVHPKKRKHQHDHNRKEHQRRERIFLSFLSSSMKIQDVAGASGFSDASHFIAMFRKVTGTTPLDFRKMY